MNTTQEELTFNLDDLAETLIRHVRERASDVLIYEDWEAYFREARKHPDSEWVRNKAHETLIEALKAAVH